MHKVIDSTPAALLHFSVTAVLVLGTLVPGTGPLYAKPEFPPPKDAQVQWVGRNIEVNGIRSDIRAFHTSKSAEKVAEFYRQEWKDPVGKGMPGYTETDAMPPCISLHAWKTVIS